MSRIGKKPVPIPDGVEVQIKGATIKTAGPLGELTRDFHPEMSIVEEDGMLLVTRPSDRQFHRGLHGLSRTLLANMLEGVHTGFKKQLEIIGVGYRAELIGPRLKVVVGFSHPILIVPPPGIVFEVPEPTKIVVTGINKEMVGELAAKIRAFRPPEPYKG
ncbi:MAG: 50S ribosomal protein L6, partial [Planctomycetes bacterium]|nr:50S ribosomal protein L6 [Planctomycetota bacterium]